MAYQAVARAKINLSLDVVGQRQDGYHLLKSVMQTLSLGDVVEVELATHTSVEADMAELACDESNLAWRAYRLMRDEFALDAGVKVRLLKQIPLGGGMAGGSADAAQVLLAINELFGLGLSIDSLRKLAVRLGADVPFCLSGGTALAEGVGEQLTMLDPCPELRIVVVNPGFQVPTPRVFGQLDVMNLPPTAHTDGVLAALANGNPDQIGRAMGNALEPAAFALYPALYDLKCELLGLGLYPLLSGSGATVFGVAADKKQAAIAADRLVGKYPFVRAVTTHQTLD